MFGMTKLFQFIACFVLEKFYVNSHAGLIFISQPF